ncbi:zinc-binding dehydrogenase [Pontibacter sp. G13]|uniref:zinc-binding dehydrogenase n=1 Tax=Pontibacter sp. G13 TaxID=3074898 RepID=UPI002889CF27|nr:zinc-binding dehydrogenase [Pontibacter sp. G13]WNJ16730.1 zinc-binding dehydrogenase [Pontibacter sp. G13]
MLAYLLESFGGPEVLHLRERPDPQPKPGWVHIEIKAFGLNRSELYTRQGHSGDAVTLPRIPGIECVGVVLDGGGTDLKPGQKVAAAMGHMGRLHDGGYAHQTLIPRSNVFPVETSLSWNKFGAIPETYLTAWGVLMDAIELKPQSRVLIRGGSSSVGMACISIAKEHQCEVLATTRSLEKKLLVEQAGADHVLIDHGDIETQVKSRHPKGVDAIVELVGKPETIQESLRLAAPKGCVGMVGFLGNEWNYEFFPWMPSTVKLTMYNSETLETQSATPILQEIVRKVEQGIYRPHIYQTFSFDHLQEAHQMMEESRAVGKMVVTTS